MRKWTDKAFKTFAWIAPPHEGVMGDMGAYNTEEQYRKIAECGIDYVIDVFDSYRPDLGGEIRFSLESAKAAAKAGVGYLSADGGLSGGVPIQDPAVAEETVRRYCDELLAAGAAGHNVYDEPSSISADSRTLPQIFEYLGKIKEIYRRHYPDKIFYVNLLPRPCLPGRNYWNDFETSGREEYEHDYVEGFVRTVHPDFISFDQYNLLTSVNEQDYRISGPEDRSLGSQIWTGLLENLEIFSHVSKQYGIPFFSFVQVSEHWAGTVRHIRYPRIEDIRYQIGCQLAYGSQGVEYFTYWSGAYFGGHGDACTDAFGNLTQHYDDVKQLNEELRFLEKTYFSYRHVGTMAIRGTESEQENPDFALLRYNLKSYPGLESVQCSKDTLVGIFENEEGFACCFVNVTDPFFRQDDEVRIRFAHPGEVRAIWEKSEEVLSDCEGEISFCLPAGSYRFVTVRKGR